MPDHKEEPKEASTNLPIALVAEDEGGIRDLLCSLLTAAGYEVHGAADGAEAMRLLAAYPHAAMLFVDNNMPHKQGVEIIHSIQSCPDSFGHMRVVFMSAFPENVVFGGVWEGIRQRVHAFLHKPFHLQAVVDALTMPQPVETILF